MYISALFFDFAYGVQDSFSLGLNLFRFSSGIDQDKQLLAGLFSFVTDVAIASIVNKLPGGIIV